MKIPKEIRKKKKNVKQWTVLDVFKIFKGNYENFSRNSIPDKKKYIEFLVSRINIDGDRVFYFYNLLKEKFDLFISDLGFNCLRCERGCCELVKVNDKVSSGIVKEDFIQLRKKKVDLNGCIGLIDREIRDNTRGFYIKELKTVKDAATGLTRCYYFDSNKRSCTIYDCRPLFCYLFPFGFDIIHLGCPGLLKIFPYKSKEERERNLELELSENYLFWEYKIVSMLYMIKKANVYKS